ncbi:MAG: hypothetical protein WEG56_04465 [Chloroflexota bacterium]
MTDLKTGILLWSQAASWPEMLGAAKRVDRLGYDHLWTWDHYQGGRSRPSVAAGAA